MAQRQIDATTGVSALNACKSAFTVIAEDLPQPGDSGSLLDGEQPSSAQWKTAVRWGLQELARLAPGRAVEVRVPPAGAVQILGGTVHRRGTPPAVVEMSMATFVALAVGVVSWDELSEGGALTVNGHKLLLDASGQRTDLSGFFPLT